MKTFQPIALPAPRRKLIDLPENYLSLLSKADQYKCPNSITRDSKSPALCLVCGTIICSQVSQYVSEQLHGNWHSLDIRGGIFSEKSSELCKWFSYILSLFNISRALVASCKWIATRQEAAQFMHDIVVETTEFSYA